MIIKRWIKIKKWLRISAKKKKKMVNGNEKMLNVSWVWKSLKESKKIQK